MSNGTKGFKEATEALFEGDAETAAQRFAAATEEILATRPTIDADEIVRAASANALRELEGRPAVVELFKAYPEIRADEDLQLLADRRVGIYEAQGVSRAEAIRLAGEDVAEKFKLGKNRQQTSPRSSSPPEPSESDEAAEASGIIAEIAAARSVSQSAAASGQQSAGAYDGLEAEHRRQRAWRKLRGSDY